MNLDWNSAKKSPCSASAACEAPAVSWNALPAVGILQAQADLLAVADGTGRLTFVSSVAESALGLDPRFLVGRPLMDLVEPKDHAEMRAALVRAKKTETPITVEIRLLDACGAPHAFQAVVTNKLSHPFVRGFTLAFHQLA